MSVASTRRQEPSLQPVEGKNRQASETDILGLGASVGQLLNRRAAVGMALGVVRDGRLKFFSAHGLADIASSTPITQDTIFRIASISKTFTAIAVMQLVEQGLVDLDAPANDYLRTFKLVPAKATFRPATVRHLLTHTAGIPEMVHPSRTLGYVYGESLKLEEHAPPLGEYYRGGLRLNVEPGTKFTYTDHSFSTLGQIVEDVSGMPLDRYFREHIFEPLGMADTDLLRSERVKSRLATGYALGTGGPKRVTDRQWVTAAASMIYSSPRDMARYLAALMGGGANEHGSILKPATLATMFEPHYQPDPRIPGLGLAFSRLNVGGHRVVEHEGVLPGFNSQIFVAPDDGVGVMAFTNGARQAMLWLPAETSRVLSHVLGVAEDVIRTDIPQHPEVWADICGRYPLSAPLTDMRMRAMLGLGAEVLVRRGEPVLRVLTPIPVGFRGFPLHPDDEKDPYVFRIDVSELGLGTGRIVFSHHVGTPTRIHLDLLPISLEKKPAGKSSRFWIGGALAALAVIAARSAVRRRRGTSRRRRQPYSSTGSG
jgi:CubicO group peptidase (beta-lactamase class C family)